MTESTGNETDQTVVVEGGEVTKVQPVVELNHLKIANVVIATGGVLAVIFISYLIYRTLLLFLLLFLALLIATAIEPVVNKLRKGPLNRSAGILVVYTGIFLLLGVIGWITLPVFFQQASELGASLTRTVDDIEKGITNIDDPFLKQQAEVFVSVARSFVGEVSTAPDPNSEEAVATVRDTAVIAAEVFFAIITIFVVAYYWLTERTLVKRAAMSWFPARRANRIRRVWDDIEVKVGGWVRGQLMLMGIVGIISAVGYYFIGLQYWPALALFIAIAEAIPLVGPYIGTAPAVLVALTQPGGGLDTALIVVLFAIVLQTIEGNVLIPRIMKDTVGISPLVVIVSILFGGVIAGLAGALVAVPLAGAIQVIIQDLKAAHDSEEKFEAQTDAAVETRAEAGELVVAESAGGETRTKVEEGAKA